MTDEERYKQSFFLLRRMYYYLAEKHLDYHSDFKMHCELCHMLKQTKNLLQLEK